MWSYFLDLKVRESILDSKHSEIKSFSEVSDKFKYCYKQFDDYKIKVQCLTNIKLG